MEIKKVLIVEDDAIIAGFIKNRLEDMGFSVLEMVKTAKQAIFAANRYLPDIILMDVVLDGEMDGVEAVEQINKTMDIPVVYLTASSDENTIDRLMKTEPHGFIIKPFDDRILRSAINIAIHRHKGKKELFDTKEILRTTLDSIDDMVFTLNLRGEFTHKHAHGSLNLRYFDINQVQGKIFMKVFPQEVSSAFKKALLEVKNQGKPQIVEFSLKENEEVYWFNAKFTLRKNEREIALGYTMVISDITSFRKKDQELMLSREKLTEAQNIANIGTCDVLFKEKKFSFNDNYFEILGVDDPIIKNSFNDERLIEIIHPDDRTRYRNMRSDVIKHQKHSFSIDYRILDKNLDVRYIHSVGKVKYDEDGNPLRLLVTIQDVSWQKNNEKLRHDVELAKKEAEIKQNFFASLSHDIRNPLSGIIGSVKLLEKTAMQDMQKELIENLKLASDTLLNLVNDILDISRIEAGKLQLKEIHFNIEEIFNSLNAFYYNDIKEKDLELTFSVDKDIPPCVKGDKTRLLQILSNLVSNAIKFTEKGFVKMEAIIKEKNDNTVLLVFKVSDSGIGISKDNISEIFKAYSRIDTPESAQKEGTGLGLAISQQLTTLMGGEIKVNSEPGKGSSFIVEIPLFVPDTSTLSPEKSSRKSRPDKLDLSVLLVEDMPINQKMISLVLENIGCSVNIAGSGKEAIQLYQETTINAFEIFGKVNYDIILLDQDMPGMNGEQLLKQMNEHFTDIPPIIVLSTNENYIETQLYKNAGFSDGVLKPIDPEVLYSKLSNWALQKQNLKTTEDIDLLALDELEQKPVINKSTFDLIVRHADENDFNISELLESFIVDMESIYDQSLTAIEMNDYNALKLIVLTVKGLSGNIGASQIHAAARLMDRHIKNEDYEQATKLLPTLFEKYSVFKTTIEKQYMKVK